MDKEGTSPQVVEVLERIRGRLRHQAASSRSVSGSGSGLTDAYSSERAILTRLVSEVRAVEGQIGVVNPRPPGLANGSIQLAKRLMRRVLRWYTRPLVDYHAVTTDFLAEAIQILKSQQAQLRGLEKLLAALTAEGTGLRDQLRSRLEGIERQLEISQRQR